MCRDQRQLGAARAHYRRAAEVAKEEGDRSSEACALAAWAMMATEGGDGAQALRLIEGARGLLGQGVPPKVHAYVGTVEAVTHASAESAGNSLRALDHAQTWFARADAVEEPPWLFWLDQGDLDSRKSECYVRTQRLHDAEVAIASALANLGVSRPLGRAIALTRLATVRTRQSEIDEACSLLSQALELTTEAESPRILQRIYDVRAELQPWSTTPAVKVLDEQLAMM